MSKVLVKFTSEKLSCVRWQPPVMQGLQNSDTFVTGSWDNSVNSLLVWKLSNGDETSRKGRRDPSEASRFGDIKPPETYVEPEIILRESHVGDVTDLKFAGHQTLLVSSSCGSVQSFSVADDSKKLIPTQKWEDLHHLKMSSCPCTCMSVSGTDVATCGEDGRINVLRLDHRKPVRIIGDADSCSLNAIIHSKTHEVITVNSAGQLKVWDVRQDGNTPVRIFLVTGKKVALHCVDRHPTQPHLVAAGGEDGTLSMWDLRKEHLPVTLFDSHESHVWEVKFHPTNPNNLFTCSDDGSVLHWQTKPGLTSSRPSTPLGGFSTSGISSSQSLLHHPSAADAGSAWISSNTNMSNIDINHVLPSLTMPVNSVDIEGSNLVCGTDGEAIYLVSNVFLH